MQKLVEISSVVDSVRSNAGSALKTVQRQFEESALKAAGLGEDEEALVRLNKRAQAYLRAADAMQQATAALADDFADAIEDIALREVARKFRDSNKSTGAQQLKALNKVVADPVRQACDGDNYGTRQKLISKAFAGLIDVNLENFRAVSSLVEEVHKAAQAVLQQESNTRQRAKTMGAVPSAPVHTPQKAAAISKDSLYVCTPERRASAPNVSKPPDFEDLIGDMGSGYSQPSKAPEVIPSKSHDLLDLDFDKPLTSNSPSPGTGTSSPADRLQRRSSAPAQVSFDLNFDSLDFGASNSTPTPPMQSHSPVSPPTSNGAGFGELAGLAWTSKEDEDESCIKARVQYWQNGKNLRTMLVSLHEVVPASSSWQPVQLQDVVQPADVKSVYRKAVLAVHPDKHAAGKAGERLLGHLIFESLREEWNVYRASN